MGEPKRINQPLRRRTSNKESPPKPTSANVAGSGIGSFWQVTDPAAHEELLKSIPENPQSAYLNLEMPMLNEYEGVNVVTKYATPATH
jgi:hypothetical protein